MSRLEEVNETIKFMDDTITDLSKIGLDEKQITNMELASIATLLRSISVSMAMLVDRMAESEDPVGCEEAKPYEE